MKRRIGILTSGGDCPGLNAAIRGVTRAAYELFDAEIVGIHDGYRGLITGDYQEMKRSQFSGILTLGGTILGTARTPIVAEIARDAGLLTVGVVTKPFKFEGKRRMDQANAGIKELLGCVDSLLIIPNDRLKFATDQKVTLANAFEIADDVLLQAVTSISNLIKNTGFINLDFADVTCIMKNAGFAHMGVGHAAGKGKAEEAARMAVASPLMETSINGAHGVLINITG